MSGAAYLRAFGSYLPAQRVDNAALAARTGRTAEAIEKRPPESSRAATLLPINP